MPRAYAVSLVAALAPVSLLGCTPNGMCPDVNIVEQVTFTVVDDATGTSICDANVSTYAIVLHADAPVDVDAGARDSGAADAAVDAAADAEGGAEAGATETGCEYVVNVNNAHNVFTVGREGYATATVVMPEDSCGDLVANGPTEVRLVRPHADG